jgi:hypothetical protein
LDAAPFGVTRVTLCTPIQPDVTPIHGNGPENHDKALLEIFNGGGYDGAVTAAAGRAMPEA